jgi:hypothetical protein
MIVRGITLSVKRITLSKIRTEAYFREKLPDFTLRDAIVKEKSGFLEVEGPCNDGTYILVKGYRQFCSLQLANEQDVMCKVTPLTSPQERIIKRLRTEQLHKARTSDEKEAMIEALLPYYNSKEISELTHMPVSIVKKHEKMLAIDPALRKKRKESGAGRTGLPLILNMPNISPAFQKELLDGYFRGDIKVYEVEFFTKMVKTPGFETLLEHEKRTCFLEARIYLRTHKNKPNHIVYEQLSRKNKKKH